MIKKVLMIVYKVEDGQVLYLLGHRPNDGIWQPPTAHAESYDKSSSDTVTRELNEELGSTSFRNFIDLKESFNFKTEDGREYEERVFAIEIGDEPIKLEEREFTSYKYLPKNEAIEIVNFENHKNFIEKADKTIRSGKYPKVFIICGPGGSGKDTIIQEMLKDETFNLVKLKTVTTRPERVGDKDDKEFVSEKEFMDLFEKGELVEKNFFWSNWYGAPKNPVMEAMKRGQNTIMEVDLHGVQAFKKIFSNVVAIFVRVDIEDLRARLIKRGTDSISRIDQRIEIAKEELKGMEIADYIIENKPGQLDRSVSQVKNILKGEL